MLLSGKQSACLLGLAALFSATGCNGESMPWVELNGQRYQVELAMDEPSRVRGLMFRDQLPEQQGMLFVFPNQQPQAFWMKNTKIPLDIIYFDADLNLVSVAAGASPCRTSTCPAYPSKGPARFVLELNAGHAQRLGLKPGDRLALSPDILKQIDPPPQRSSEAAP